MSKVTDVRVVDSEQAAGLPELSDELRVALTDIAGVAREGLLAMSVAVGLQVMAELMDDEVTAVVGPKHGGAAREHDRVGGAGRPQGRGPPAPRPHRRWP